jgi:hypothetical protein
MNNEIRNNAPVSPEFPTKKKIPLPIAPFIFSSLFHNFP